MHAHEVRQVTPQCTRSGIQLVAIFRHKNYPLAPEVAPVLYIGYTYPLEAGKQAKICRHEMTKHSYVANHAR